MTPSCTWPQALISRIDTCVDRLATVWLAARPWIPTRLRPKPKKRRGSFSADFGLHGRVKPPACEGRILVGGPPVRKVVSLCVSLARLGSLWLKRSQTQQGEPVRMALPSHYFARAFALALRASTADEAVMVQVKLQ